MIEKEQKKGTVKFTFKAPNGAGKAAVAGDFSGWKPQPMRKQKDGCFSLVLTLKPGTYEYKFVCDGEWCVDPDNSNYALNPYGTLNSVATIA